MTQMTSGSPLVNENLGWSRSILGSGVLLVPLRLHVVSSLTGTSPRYEVPVEIRVLGAISYADETLP